MEIWRNKDESSTVERYTTSYARQKLINSLKLQKLDRKYRGIRNFRYNCQFFFRVNRLNILSRNKEGFWFKNIS